MGSVMLQVRVVTEKCLRFVMYIKSGRLDGGIMMTEMCVKEGIDFNALCDRMKELHAKKGDGYVKDVIGELPIEMWTSQIVIKATRAHYAKGDDKRVDELFDTAVYCLLVLERMAQDGIDMAPIMGVGNHAEMN
jgi:hypothetical protein